MSILFTDFKEFRFHLMHYRYEIEYLYDCVPGVEIVVRNFNQVIVCRSFGKTFEEAEQKLMENWNDR